MQAFTELFVSLDSTTATNAKVAALRHYLEQAPAADAAWAIYIVSGRRAKRLAGRPLLKDALQTLTGYPEWMVLDAYATVGDFAETASLLTEEVRRTDASDGAHSLAHWMEQEILPLADLDDEARKQKLMDWWQRLPQLSAFLVTKLITGGLRVGVSQTLVARAVAELADLPRDVITHRLMGEWQPSAGWFAELTDPDISAEKSSRPYPFYLASPLEQEPAELGDREQWLAEWKWDGIRAQLVKRGGEISLWSRGEELITERFPEVIDAAASLEDCVLDGELLAWKDQVLPFAELQRRIGRKTVGKKLLAEVPVRLLVYDCLEHVGRDLRAEPMQARRDCAEQLTRDADQRISTSPLLGADSWEALADAREGSRERGVEGLMLKAIDSPYLTGRKKGAWWKWKVEPLTVDAVMIYAQAGSGRRATLFTDYTFAVWTEQDGERSLVPIAKAYSGLTDAEINKLNRWIRANTIERFGPVRSVAAEQVFELAFEGINASTRHKSGVALRFPRIARWRTDLPPEDANTLDQVQDLLQLYGHS
ncbi:MAG: ATP-dependent DNA ligase [Halieaceae bacterium]|jgi:DNA ligase-1|nr:ATP-dependent DNA ligase [Halieaceae bacterium]